MSLTTAIRKILPTKFKDFLRIVYTTRNWGEVMLVKWRFKKSCTARFRSGHRVPVSRDRQQWLDYISYVIMLREVPETEVVGDAVKVRYRGRDLLLFYGRWGVNVGTEMFRTEPYKKFLEEFDITGRVVVDVGANIGDTAMYFALWGAKHVYAYEPFPGWCLLAQKNVAVNGFSGVCDVFLAGVGEKSGFFMEDPTFKNLVGADPSMDRLLDGMKPGEKIPLVSLEDIVKKFNITGGFLKVDCEGYEYDVFLEAPDDVLKHFDYILVEYHYGFEDLEKKFRDAGFTVWHSKPEYASGYPPQNGRERYVGYLTARRT